MLNDVLQRARTLIGDATPLNTDCGALCAAACCQADADGQGGVTLFPGEAEWLGAPDWGRLETDKVLDAPMLNCTGPCDRARRPLGCRIFPLTPVPGKAGGWSVRIDARARAMCPLARTGVRGLNPAFVAGVKAAVNAIAADAEGEAFLRKWAVLEAEYRRPLF